MNKLTVMTKIIIAVLGDWRVISEVGIPREYYSTFCLWPFNTLAL